MTIHGYTRVSTSSPSDDLQRQALIGAGVDQIWAETASGVATTRPVLEQLVDQVVDGDTVIVWRLARLGRSLAHLVATITQLTEAGVHVRSLHEQIDTQTATGRMMLKTLGTLAEFERDLLIEGHAGRAVEPRPPGAGQQEGVRMAKAVNWLVEQYQKPVRHALRATGGKFAAPERIETLARHAEKVL